MKTLSSKLNVAANDHTIDATCKVKAREYVCACLKINKNFKL